MEDKKRKNEGGSEKGYKAVILIFAAVQVMIAFLQFIQSSIEAQTNLGKNFGLASSGVMALIMFYMYKLINDDESLNKTQDKPVPDLIAKQKEEKEKNLEKILIYFTGHEKVTNDDVEKLLGVSDATATRYLEELEKEGKVRQVGTEGRFVYYEKI